MVWQHFTKISPLLFIHTLLSAFTTKTHHLLSSNIVSSPHLPLIMAKKDLIFVGFIFLQMFLPSTCQISLELKRASLKPAVGAPFFNFTLLGTSDLSGTGYYYTKVKVGTPPREFTLVIDTGSDLTWMSCSPCVGCPPTNEFGMLVAPYNSNWSSSASKIGCSDNFCQITKSACHTRISKCSYSIDFDDGSVHGGYFVQDTFEFEATMNGLATTDSSIPIIFGCSHLRTGAWASNNSIDGVLGLGHHSVSIISQLSSRRALPKIFSHCLRRDSGGLLVLGEYLHPGVVYSPLLPSKFSYNLNLRSIGISGEIVPIASEFFGSDGVVIDMGISVSVLGETLYDPIINSLLVGASLPDQPVFNTSTLCFLDHVWKTEWDPWHTVDGIFPVIHFNFEGGALMIVRPKDYFTWQYINDTGGLCIGFKKGHKRTVLGDHVLKDRIVTYDIPNWRLGWMDYNCSQSVNDVNTARRNTGSSTVYTCLKSVLASIATLLIYIFTS